MYSVGQARLFADNNYLNIMFKDVNEIFNLKFFTICDYFYFEILAIKCNRINICKK